MPLSPTTPANLEVEGPKVAKDLDTMHIHKFAVSINPNDASKTTAEVLFSEGYMDDDTYVPVKYQNVVLSGSALTDKIAEATGGGTIYNEVKAALWGLMQDAGHAPAGPIT